MQSEKHYLGMQSLGVAFLYFFVYDRFREGVQRGSKMKPFTKIPKNIGGKTILMIYHFFSIISVPRRYSRLNYLHNLQILDQDKKLFMPGNYIENQYEWGQIHFGCNRQHNMAYSGCEIMAVYNARLAMGEAESAEDLAELIRHFERRGAALLGDFGTSPKAVYRYLKKQYEARLRYYRQGEAVSEELSEGQAALITFFNEKGNLQRGIHTICATYTCEGCYLHNTYYRSGPRNDFQVAGPYASLSEALEKRYQDSIGIVCTIILQKRR